MSIIDSENNTNQNTMVDSLDEQLFHNYTSYPFLPEYDSIKYSSYNPNVILMQTIANKPKEWENEIDIMLQELEQWENDKKSIQKADTEGADNQIMDSTIPNIYNTGYKDNAPITKSELWINKISTMPMASIIKEM